jgi:triacylglycerol esterase/lipase EstA (alpha/beta hydrolase family)
MSRIRLAITMLVAAAALVAAPVSAQARTLPVNYDFATGALAGFLFPQTPPPLANHGYCVFTFNYGGSSASSVVQGTGDIAASADQLASFVTRVRAATGAVKVDLVGHSQGGMMPRYYLKFLGGASFVNKLVALAPSNHGTTLDGLTALVRAFGAAGLVNGALNALSADHRPGRPGAVLLGPTL